MTGFYLVLLYLKIFSKVLSLEADGIDNFRSRNLCDTNATFLLLNHRPILYMIDNTSMNLNWLSLLQHFTENKACTASVSSLVIMKGECTYLSIYVSG